MKLSEAIRLGAMLRPQGFGSLFHGGGSCAKGAACEATGFPYPNGARYRTMEGEVHLRKVFPFVIEIEKRSCPQCGCPIDPSNDNGAIAHLNDIHEWTREQIADWVATVEPADAVESAPIVEHAAACAVKDGY